MMSKPLIKYLKKNRLWISPVFLALSLMLMTGCDNQTIVGAFDLSKVERESDLVSNIDRWCLITKHQLNIVYNIMCMRNPAGFSL